MSSKTFYLETFGCQMNVHDSEKVIGTLMQQGYRQVETVEEADLILYNTCSIRDKAEQKVFNRLNDYKKSRSRARSLASSAASRSRRAKRFSSARHTFRWWPVQRRIAICLRCWCRSKQGIAHHRSRRSRDRRDASKPNSPPAPIRIAATSPSSKDATSSAPTASCPITRGKERSRTPPIGAG